MATKSFYKNESGGYIFNDTLLANTAPKQLEKDGITSIKFTYNETVMYHGLITDLTDIGGTSYADYDALIAGVGGFFANASADGATTADLTATYLPIMTATNLGDSCLYETDTTLVSSKTIEVPPGSVYIGQNAKLSGAIRALNIKDEVLDRKGLLLSQIYDETGSSNAFSYKIDAETLIEQNTSTTETSSFTQFVRTPLNDEVINAFHIRTSNISISIAVDIKIRLGSHTGTTVFETSGSYLTDATGEAVVELGNPIITDKDLDLYVEYLIPNMYGSTILGEFVPNHSATVQLLERIDIAPARKPYLHVRRTTDLTIGSETLLSFDTVVDSNEITVSSEVITMNKSGIYVSSLSCYVYEDSDPILYFWVEKSTDSGTTWAICDGMIKTRIASDGSSTNPLRGFFHATAGDQYRIKIKEIYGTAILQTSTTSVTLGSINQYPADLTLAKVSDI